MFKYILIELEYYVIFIKILFPTEYKTYTLDMKYRKEYHRTE